MACDWRTSFLPRVSVLLLRDVLMMLQGAKHTQLQSVTVSKVALTNRSSRRRFISFSFPVCLRSCKGEILNFSIHQSRLPSSHPSRTTPRLLPDGPCPGNPLCIAKFLHEEQRKKNKKKNRSMSIW